MLKLKKIAITGGVASGKSTVCQFFKKLGACVVDADRLGHELLDPNTDLGKKIIKQFGPEILENGQISRMLIAEKAFQDKNLLQKLEELLHPAILLKIEELYISACSEDKYTSFCVEIPLLFEVGAEIFYDITVTVLSNEEEAKKRFTKAGFEETQYDKRMNCQLKPGQKAAKSQIIISNNGSLEDLEAQVNQLNRTIYKQ